MNIAIYLQHYLAPSMTFIYRQITEKSSKHNKIILCSRRLEHQKIFPYTPIYYNDDYKLALIRERVFRKLYGNEYLLGSNPKLSHAHKHYFTNLLIKNNINLIHAHFGPSALEIFPIAKKLKIPLLISFHGYDGSNLLRYRKYIQNLKKLLGYATVIFPSEFMKDQVKGAVSFIRNYLINHYGIPINEFQFINRTPIAEKIRRGNEIIFLQISNFVEKKGHIYTIRAFNKFQKTLPNSRLIIAGNGKLKFKIMEEVKKLKLSTKIIFPGSVDYREVASLMSKADIFLHHSVTAANGDQEGIPNAIMEAMSTGLPVVSTDHAGIPELIDNGVDGLLTSERDIDEYVESMHKIISNSDNYAKKAREKIEKKFNLEIQNMKIERLYSQLALV